MILVSVAKRENLPWLLLVAAICLVGGVATLVLS